jgi:hypothetical protein
MANSKKKKILGKIFSPLATPKQFYLEEVDFQEGVKNCHLGYFRLSREM